MNRPIIKIVNVETGEELEREMTDTEFADYEANNAAEAQKVAEKKLEAESKAAARQAILDRLGLTEEEARLLLG